MKIFDFFKNTNLTSQQKEAVLLIEKFLLSDTDIFILKGYAGTGKTFLMKGLTDYFFDKNIGFSLMSPTGRAAKVLSKRKKKQLIRYISQSIQWTT